MTALRLSAAEMYYASELRAIEDFKKLFIGYETWPDDKIEKVIKELTEGLDSGDNVWNNFDAEIFRYTSEAMEKHNITFSALEQAAPSFADDILRYEQLYLRKRLPEKINYHHIEKEVIKTYTGITPPTQAEELASYMRKLDTEMSDLKKRLHSRGISKNTQVEVRDRFETKIGYGAAGLGAAIMLALDKSIWGYDERQVSKHWNQIFVENSDFKDTRVVKDVMFILQALAAEFDFVVNARALQLAN